MRTIMGALAVLCLILAPAAASCGGDAEKGSIVTVTGTITYLDLEGGFYGIMADSGERYYPLNLDKQYQVNGLKIRVGGKVRMDVITTTMWGTPLEIVKIERR